jgi:hypothetical protein
MSGCAGVVWVGVGVNGACRAGEGQECQNEISGKAGEVTEHLLTSRSTYGRGGGAERGGASLSR